MKPSDPSSLAQAAELRRMLRQLGQDGASEPMRERRGDRESAREARMAASVERELQKQVRARRSARRMLGLVAAAAAAVALGLGVRQVRFGSGPLAISPEPTASINAAGVAPSAEQLPSQPAIVSVPPRAAPRAASISTAAAPPSAVPSSEPPSTLAEENRLFKAAAESARNGDVPAAVAQLDELLTEHPTSPLAQTALVRKFRLLAKAGRLEDARREAQRYLTAYPTGFAVSEARALLAAGEEKDAL